ncbi:STE3-domain-containing protein [Tricholoma matsutake]|nr:STE3-domain-containing protein [Tricholoma matsutake 945]
MHAELPVISFLCFAFLVVFIPIRRVRCNVVNLAIVSWLAGCNLVHGINSLIWSGNVDIRVPVWCDIVTKLLLATMVAISGAILCMSYRLELLSSTRPISVDPKSQRNRLLIDFVFCYVVPVIYMVMHFVVQDHRFDLVKDMGCSASIHPSSPALILMWIPPLIICSISLYFSTRAMHNLGKMPYNEFSRHIESRSPMTSSLFYRRIATSFIITGSLCVICLFSVFSISTFESWTSWSAVHAEFSVIDVVTAPADVESILVTWWGIPTVSMIYIFLSFVIGEEMRDALKRTRRELPELVSRMKKPLSDFPMFLSRHITITQEASESFSLSQSLSTPRPRPQTLELKSGWDDMLDDKKSKRWIPGTKYQTSTAASDSPNSSLTSISEDDIFTAATRDYLISPTAKTLGLPGFSPTTLMSLPPVHTSGNPTFDVSPRPFIHPPTVKSHSAPPQDIPEDAKSTTSISSIFDAPWPLPPPSPASIAPFRNFSRPRSTSPAAFNVNSGYPVYPTTATSRRQSRPFQDFVPSAQGVHTTPQATVFVSKRPSLNSLRRTLSSEKFGFNGTAPGDVIYVTVVKETV